MKKGKFGNESGNFLSLFLVKANLRVKLVFLTFSEFIESTIHFIFKQQN